MSGSDSDLDVPPEALKLIASGIDKAHGELKDLGMIGEASTGRGFSDLSLSGMQLGHEGLASGFKTFCERWEWGVRALMMRGNGFAKAVGLSAGAISEQEQYIKDTFKIAVNGMNGNPHLTEEEVKAKDWDEIRDQHAWDGADWSAESFSEAHKEVKQTWRDTGYDVEDGLLDAMQNQGVLGAKERELMDEKLRETLEPTQGAVDRAKQPTWGSE
ncbi:hypothetical protein ACGFZK_04965 [Streptomyces sp. NPDC048257]|uniref:hypothetical protein n=1 Tax=Streptomyces sp. NPDC048257 TaxID=3365526 RepID=UPI003719F739